MIKKVTKFTVEITFEDLASKDFLGDILDSGEYIHNYKILKEETVTRDIEE